MGLVVGVLDGAFVLAFLAVGHLYFSAIVLGGLTKMRRGDLNGLLAVALVIIQESVVGPLAGMGLLAGTTGPPPVARNVLSNLIEFFSRVLQILLVDAVNNLWANLSIF